ncbi:PD-(D/E)XK nuclease family protein [Raoultibacter phocaeensis]|uniref:PD-(D/E)XK nuclease family protein n=1 Tax=Raoultibacter phocaeensis TaxID=2479841 RepID=UPI00111BC2FF|nr:PD-(D/E)XK nuclease family protein [Raoultibacter phocaeensis]
MTLSIVSVSNKAAADEAAYSQAHRALDEGAKPVIVVSAYEETVRLKEAWSTRSPFGIDIVEFSSWIADLWELFGDGRSIVNAVQRQLIAGEVLSCFCSERRAALLQPTPGTRRFIASAAREALPNAVLGSDLGEGEREAVEVLRLYRERAAEANLVEQAEAVAILTDPDVLAGYRPIVVGASLDDFTAIEQALLGQADAVLLENERSAVAEGERAPELAELLASLYRPDEAHPVEASGAVRFVLPAGRYASAQALCDAIEAMRAHDGSASVVVAARDPHTLFEGVAERLAVRGIASEVRGTVPFSATEFGSAWLALLETLDGDSPFVARAATDFALSAYSGVGVRSAYWMDARWRANRAIDRDSVLTDLAGTADHGLNGLVGLLESGRASDALDLLQAHVGKQVSWPEGYRDRQMSALASARTVYDEAVALGASREEYRSVLEDQRLFAKLAVEPGRPGGARVAPAGSAASETSKEPRGMHASAEANNPVESCAQPVLIVDLETAASLGPSTCDVLFAVDLTATSYPVRDEGGTLATLLEKLGAARERDGLASIRATFADALAVPRAVLFLSRPLNNEAGDEERPAVVFEDVIDCYRRDLQNPAEVDKKTGLTEALGRYALVRGEQSAFVNLSASGEPQDLSIEIPVTRTGSVTAAAREKILLPMQWGGVVSEGRNLSPSAIESYLECPYKWFAHRRLRLEELDAGFGGREFGLFAHRVLERFYAQFRCEVAPKVSPDTLDRAKRILSCVFDEQLAYDATLIGDPAALVPLDDLERREVADLKRKLLGYLDREAQLLSGFVPLDAEVGFGRTKGAFEYAGFMVNGTIDRVDVDGFGRAVVIDYKGAVGKAYALREKAGEPFALPRKVQTLIYAQAVRKTMGLQPVGALYVSYGKDGGIAGSFDHAVLDPGKDLLGIDAARCATTDFENLLDTVEEAIAARLEGLLAGEIRACPRDADACTYCPVTVCSVRDAVQREREGGE